MALGLKINEDNGNIVDEFGKLTYSKLLKCGCETLMNTDKNQSQSILDDKESISKILNTGIMDSVPYTNTPVLSNVPNYINESSETIIYIDDFKTEGLYNITTTVGNIIYTNGNNYFVLAVNELSNDTNAILKITCKLGDYKISLPNEFTIPCISTGSLVDQTVLYNATNISYLFNADENSSVSDNTIKSNDGVICTAISDTIIQDNGFDIANKVLDITNSDLKHEKVNIYPHGYNVVNSPSKIYVDNKYTPKINDIVYDNNDDKYLVTSVGSDIGSVDQNNKISFITSNGLRYIKDRNGDILRINENGYEKYTESNGYNIISYSDHAFYIDDNNELWESNDSINYHKVNIGYVKSVSVENNYTIVLKNDGTLWGKGYFYYISSLNNTDTFVNLGLTNIVKFYTSYSNIFAIDNLGVLHCIGGNYYGVLGTGNNTYTQTWVIPGINNVKDVVLSNYSVCVLKNDGTLWTCGNGTNGIIGDGNYDNRTIFVRSGSITADSIYAGSNSFYALKSNGELWCVGSNDYGQLGIGNTNNQSSWVRSGGDKLFKYVYFKGMNTALGVIDGDDDNVYACGAEPIPGMDLIDGSNYSNLTWTKFKHNFGFNQYTYITTDKPFQINDGVITVDYIYDIVASENKDIISNLYASDTNKIYVDTKLHIPKVNESFYINNYSNNKYIVKNAIIENIGVPGPGSDMVSTGETHTLILRNDGTVWGIGYNYSGQLGIGNTTDPLDTPIKLTNELCKYVIANKNSSYIVTVNGTLLVAGDNDYGQLGIGNTEQQITWLESPISDIKQISCGDSYAIILKNDGTVWGSGYNFDGQLGVGTNTNSAIWIKSNISNINKIYSFTNQCYALDNDNILHFTGRNTNKQSGKQSIDDKYLEWVKSGIQDVIDIGASSQGVLFITRDYELYAIGYDNYGNLGTGKLYKTINNILKIDIPKPKSIYMSEDITFILTTSGDCYVAGNNSNKLIDTSSNPNITIFKNTYIKNVVDISVSSYGSTSIVTSDGSLYYTNNIRPDTNDIPGINKLVNVDLNINWDKKMYVDTNTNISEIPTSAIFNTIKKYPIDIISGSDQSTVDKIYFNESIATPEIGEILTIDNGEEFVVGDIIEGNIKYIVPVNNVTTIPTILMYDVLPYIYVPINIISLVGDSGFITDSVDLNIGDILVTYENEIFKINKIIDNLNGTVTVYPKLKIINKITVISKVVFSNITTDNILSTDTQELTSLSVNNILSKNDIITTNNNESRVVTSMDENTMTAILDKPLNTLPERAYINGTYDVNDVDSKFNGFINGSASEKGYSVIDKYNISSKELVYLDNSKIFVNIGDTLITDNAEIFNVGNIVKESPLLSNSILSVSVAGTNISLIDNTGIVWGIGDNSYGQLGDGTTNNSNEWVKSSGMIGIKVVNNNNTTYVLKANGEIWFTGMDVYGGAVTTWTIIYGIKAKDISVSNTNVLIIKMDNSVWAIGATSENNIGVDNGGNDFYEFVDTGMYAKEIYSLTSRSMVVGIDDTVYVVGDNIFNAQQWTDTGLKAKSVVFTDISMYVIDFNDDLWVAGYIENGMLGIVGNNVNNVITNFTKTPYANVESVKLAFRNKVLITLKSGVVLTNTDNYNNPEPMDTLYVPYQGFVPEIILYSSGIEDSSTFSVKDGINYIYASSDSLLNYPEFTFTEFTDKTIRRYYKYKTFVVIPDKPLLVTPNDVIVLSNYYVNDVNMKIKSVVYNNNDMLRCKFSDTYFKESNEVRFTVSTSGEVLDLTGTLTKTND